MTHSSTEPESRLPAADEPLGAAAAWLEQARASGLYRNPGAMALATVGADGRPAARMVLVRDFSVDAGFAAFYTNYASRKARELEHNARAAGVLYWEALGRQLRLEGIAARSPAAESDAYFANRSLGSRINACVSRQSRPIDDFAELDRRMREKRAEVEARDGECERPASWGGYRIWLDSVEFWVEGEDRFHERVVYERRLRRRGDGYAGGAWTRTLLQP